jgi:hypothetical protein
MASFSENGSPHLLQCIKPRGNGTACNRAMWFCASSSWLRRCVSLAKCCSSNRLRHCCNLIIMVLIEVVSRSILRRMRSFSSPCRVVSLRASTESGGGVICSRTSMVSFHSELYAFHVIPFYFTSRSLLALFGAGPRAFLTRTILTHGGVGGRAA